MKISLIRDRNLPIKADGTTQVHHSDIGGLPDSIADSIDCEDVLDYVKDRRTILFLLSKKLKRGGVLVVRGLDFMSYAEHFADKREGLDGLMARESVSYYEEMVELIKTLNLQIVNAFISNERYIIKTERKI